MNAYAKALLILERQDIDYRAVVFEVGRIAPAVLIRAVDKPPQWERKARELIGSDLYIEAIKHCRSVTGWGLKEAKDACDKLHESMGLAPRYPV